MTNAYNKISKLNISIKKLLKNDIQVHLNKLECHGKVNLLY